MRLSLEYDSPYRMLYLAFRQLAKSSAVAAARSALLRTLVPPRLWMPGGTGLHARRLDPELSLRPDGHSRYPHGISTPTACLPAFALPTATTSGMPCPATACEPRSICVVPCTSSSLCTCRLACQTAANDVAATAPSGSSCLLSALVYSVLLPLYLRLSYLDRSALCQEKSCPPTCPFVHSAGQAVFLHRSGRTLGFHTPKWAFLVIRSAKAARSPSEPRQLLGPHQIGRSIGTVFVL